MLILLAFHEFLSDLLHIYRMNSWDMGNFLGTQKFRFLTHKWDIFTKMYIFEFSKMVIFGGVMSKIEFLKNWCYRYDLYYGFGSNDPIHDFPQLFYIKVGRFGRIIKKIIFSKKMAIFKSKIWPRGLKTDPIGKPQ